MWQSLLFALTTTATIHAPNHNWKLLDGKFWQIDEPAKFSFLPLQNADNICSAGMVHVKGKMKQDPDSNQWGGKTIEALQKTTCTKWINRNYPERCAEFDRDKWISISKNFKTKDMDFCIDRFEYPNKVGEYPMIMMNFNEAKEMAAANNKRLCTEEEWGFACEGEEAIPYGYGYKRKTEECGLDKNYRPAKESQLRHRDRIEAGLEVDRLWQGSRSGDHPTCDSAFGVGDMNSNVDEITLAVRPSPYKLALRSGSWTGVRNRCRPTTRNHNEFFYFYQISFRQCSDIKL